MEKYDLCVIGGGPSGYAAAMRAMDFGKKVVLVEADKLGGAGIYNGALSSKTMWEASTKFAIEKKDGSGNKLDFKSVMKIVDEAVFERKTQMTCHLKLLQSETKRNLLFYEKGMGALLDKNHIKIIKGEKEKIIYAENIILSTGSSPRKLPNIPIDEKIIVTSDGISQFDDFPESMVILGAGVIGCEFATIFSNFGKTKVHLIDKAPRILPFEDEDIADTVTKNLEENGVVIHKNSSLSRIEIVDGRVEYELLYKDGTKEVLNVEKALVSVGRVPNIKGLNLEAAGIKMNDHGGIWEDDTQTSVPNIYVAGDLTSGISLLNVGEREGRHAVARMFGYPVKPLVYTNISTIMFLNPEVASVGMGELEALQKNIPVKIAKIDYSCIARAIAMRKTQGFFKIIVTNDEEMRILGMRAVGEHASSAIQAVALLIYMNKGIDELANMLCPHPTIVEGIQECVRMFLGKSIYKSSVFRDKLKCFSSVNGVYTPLDRL